MLGCITKEGAMVFSHSRKFRAWVSKKRAHIAAFTLTGLAVVPLAVVGIVTALTDMTPPTITSFSVSTQQVDLDDEPVPVTVSGTVTDNLSGFGTLKMYYTSPSGHQVAEAQTTSSTSTSFEAEVTFPYHAEAGVWTPVATISDASGNIEQYTAEELSGLGFDLDVTASSSTPDTTSPVLTNLEQISSSTLNVENNAEDYVFFATVTDENSSVASVNFRIISPSGRYYLAVECAPTAIEDMYGCQKTVDLYVESGSWPIQVTVSDRAGNSHTYDAADLSNMNFPNKVDVVSVPDTDPVVIDSLNFSPFYVHHEDANPGGVVVTAQGFYSDAFAGVAQANLVYKSQTSTQSFVASGYVEDSNLTQWHYEYIIVTPPYPAEGDWLPELTTLDGIGNEKVYSHADLLALGINLKITIGEGVVTLAAPGNTVTTDTTQSGATAENPVQTAVTTPVAGTVSITPVETTAPAEGFSGYDVIGNQYTIVAPSTTAESPLVFNFTLDASQVVGKNASDIVVFRDGEPVEKCLGSSVAVPDPCETAYATDENGDVTITVLSTHASRWLIGTKQEAAPEFTFQGFKKLDLAPKLNKDQAGSTIPVKFSLGGNYGTDVLAVGSPTSRKVSCTTLAPKTDELAALSADKNLLKVNGNEYYRYDWKTLKGWDDTCREFKLKFTTGETTSVYFKF